MGNPMDFSDFIDLLELIDEQHRYGLSSGKQVKTVYPTIDMANATVTSIQFSTGESSKLSSVYCGNEDSLDVAVMNWLESKEII